MPVTIGKYAARAGMLAEVGKSATALKEANNNRVVSNILIRDDSSSRDARKTG
jgi:hypothetical protein